MPEELDKHVAATIQSKTNSKFAKHEALELVDANRAGGTLLCQPWARPSLKTCMERVKVHRNANQKAAALEQAAVKAGEKASAAAIKNGADGEAAFAASDDAAQALRDKTAAEASKRKPARCSVCSSTGHQKTRCPHVDWALVPDPPSCRARPKCGQCGRCWVTRGHDGCKLLPPSWYKRRRGGGGWADADAAAHGNNIEPAKPANAKRGERAVAPAVMAARVAVGAGAGARATRCPKRRRQPAHVDDGGHMHKVQHRSGGFIMIYEQLFADYQEDQKSAKGGVVPEHLKWHEDCCADPCVWEEGDEAMSYMCDFCQYNVHRMCAGAESSDPGYSGSWACQACVKQHTRPKRRRRARR
jgi:hypothetical protein